MALMMPTPLVCMAAICAVILATPVLACTDQTDAVVALLEHDASVNSHDNDSAPAPHCAVATGSPYVVRLLVNISGVLDEPAHCVNQTAAGVVPVALAAEHVPLNATEPQGNCSAPTDTAFDWRLLASAGLERRQQAGFEARSRRVVLATCPGR